MDFERMRFLIREIPDARLRVERAWSKAQKVTQVLDDMPHGTDVSSQVENGVVLVEKMQGMLDGMERELAEMRASLSVCIQKSGNTQHAAILSSRYMEGMSARRIAETMGYSEQRIFQMLREAEKSVRMMMLVGEVH